MPTKDRIGHENVHAEIANLIAETAKISKRNIYLELAITASGTLAVLLILKHFLQ